MVFRGVEGSQKLQFTVIIGYIYEILNCNQFFILSNSTAYETNTIKCSGIAENEEVVAVEKACVTL